MRQFSNLPRTGTEKIARQVGGRPGLDQVRCVMATPRWIIAAAGLTALSGGVAAFGDRHSDPVAPVILGVTAILIFAVIGRYFSRRLGQPSVLGELVVGILLGNVIYLFGGDFILALREGTALFDVVDLTLSGLSLQDAAAQRITDPLVAEKMVHIIEGPYGGQLLGIAHTIDIFSRYGVIFLLFLVGLESSMEEMQTAGLPSLRVAVVGMLTPFLLGLAVAWLVLSDNSLGVLLFIGATLGATSVGITARVLSELKVLHCREARIILGAAIFDDVLGLISLAIVSGIVVHGAVQGYAIAQILGLSALFVVAALFGGPYVLRVLISAMRGLGLIEAKIFSTFIFVMGLSWFADLVGLATIIGAFAAGLIMNDCYFRGWEEDCERSSITIKSLMEPLEAILVPIFFVLIGLQVKLESFFNAEVLLFAAGLTIAAIVGKLVSGYVAGRGLNHLAVGLGMMPRGEVGLIFASIGKGLGVIDSQLFSAIVLMVVITTVISPSLLKRALRNGVCHNADSESTAGEQS
jgi:Kef-type K+ transport system membrane component KefB